MADIPLAPQSDVYQPVDVGDLGASAIQQGGNMVGGSLEGLGNQAIQTYKANSRSTMFNQLYLYSSSVNDARTSIMADPSDNNIATQQQLLDKNFADSQNLNLTPRDSASMSKVMQGMRNTFNLQAAIQSKKNTNIDGVTNLENSLQDTYSGIHEAAALGDTQTANNMMAALNEQTAALTQSGGLSPQAAQRINGLAANLRDRGSQLAPILAPGALAQIPAGQSLMAYEKALNVTPSTSLVNPQNPNSQQLANIDTTAFTIDDAKQQAVQGNLPKTFLSRPDISNAQFNSVLNTYKGAAAARSLVMLGNNYNTLNSYLKTAQSIPFPNSYQDAYRASLKNTIDSINNGGFFDYYTKQTSNGTQALLDYNNAVTSYSNSSILSPQAKASYLAEAQNDFVNKLQGFATSHGIPQQYVKPFPSNDPTFQTLGNAFIPGGDVSGAMSILNGNSKMTPYYIQGLMDPVHQQAATLASFANNSRDQARVLLANQNNVPGTPKIVPLDSDGKAVSDDSTLKLLAGNSNYNNYKNYLQDVPGGASQLGSMQKAILNSVKLCQVNTNNSQEQCVQQVAGILPDSRMSGSVDAGGRYNFLPNYFGSNVSDSDAKAIADYAVNQGYQKLQSTLSAVGAAGSQDQFNTQRAVNGLTVINTPFHTVQVLNPQTGKTIVEMPITDHLLTSARMYAQKNDTVKGAIPPASFADYVANIGG